MGAAAAGAAGSVGISSQLSKPEPESDILEKVWLEKLGKGLLAAVRDGRLAASSGGNKTAAALGAVSFSMRARATDSTKTVCRKSGLKSDTLYMVYLMYQFLLKKQKMPKTLKNF